MSAQNILALGASKNIGYFAAIRLLDAGATVTFLLRNPAVFDEDEIIKNAVSAGKAFLVKGDGLNQDDVARAWAEATSHGHVDTLLFTVGGVPKGFSLTKGFIIEPHNLVTQCLLNTLCTIPKDAPQPRIVVVSSIGLTKRSHSSLPLIFKPLYAHALAMPHRDKLGVERVLAHCAGLPWDASEEEPADDIVGAGWRERQGLPGPGELKQVLIVRPALLTDGECKADNKKEGREPYRAEEKELGGYTVSRKDVGHFIFKAVTSDWNKYGGKIINVGY
ncbi:hypothetical protein K525DRAFT_239770 [Schizophyllum commune Loenen D]|nr:hypothetical protein K525DRAFT_239770 [Schizophyllum commune Loenen D]